MIRFVATKPDGGALVGLILEPGNLERLQTETSPIHLDLHTLLPELVPIGTELLIDFTSDPGALAKRLLKDAQADGGVVHVVPPEKKGAPS